MKNLSFYILMIGLLTTFPASAFDFDDLPFYCNFMPPIRPEIDDFGCHYYDDATIAARKESKKKEQEQEAANNQKQKEYTEKHRCQNDDDCVQTVSGGCVDTKFISANNFQLTGKKGECFCKRGPVLFGCVPLDR